MRQNESEKKAIIMINRLNKQKIYERCPDILQCILLNLVAYNIQLQRFGKKYDKIMSWLDETDKWSYGELLAYQDEQLKSIVKHSYETVPFYNEIMKSLKLVPSDIKSISDLHKMPIITKADVKKNLRNMISIKFKASDLVHGHTSGTTGAPLDLYWDKGMVVMNNAMDWRQKKWAGFSPGDPHGVILGRVIVPIKNGNPPFWRMNYVHNELWLSAFHMSSEKLDLYVKRLEKFKPKYLEGYPSTMYILARHLLNTNRTMPLDAVFTSSETLFPAQKEEIEQAFQCRIYDFYGMAERVVFASECSMHNGKHLNLEYGVTEIVDNNGLPVPVGTEGKLIGTSLHNYGMPLIRYQTNDITCMMKELCECGRSHPLIESIKTKHEDIVITPEGRWISPSVLTHPFKPQKNIIESQIIQERKDLLKLKIVKSELFSDTDKEKLIYSLKERLGPFVSIEIEFVDSIPRDKSGKFRWVISKVPKSDYSLREK